MPTQAPIDAEHILMRFAAKSLRDAVQAVQSNGTRDRWGILLMGTVEMSEQIQLVNRTSDRTVLSVILGAMFTAILFCCGGSASAATLEVGPGKSFVRIEEANAKAQPGDVILVYPREDSQPYEQTAICVRQKNLTFRAVSGGRTRWVTISGKGFDYSGVGSTPRAIFQFNPGADHCILEGFELTGAHNNSHNGAGVRINQANHVTIRNCVIYHNDMGVMSNGDGSLTRGVNQRMEHCRIHHNGDLSEPGYNHNLYLGGTSVRLRFCEIHSSLTGHNVKSRAHHTRVEYCYVHDSANREFDLVDAAETTKPESHAVLMGNIIVKSPRCEGNRAVIHFGQDSGKEHDGTLHLDFNTIVTPLHFADGGAICPKSEGQIHRESGE